MTYSDTAHCTLNVKNTQSVNPLMPTVAISVQLKSILCQSRHL